MGQGSDVTPYGQRCFGGCNVDDRGVRSDRCWLCINELLMSFAWELLIAEIECLSLITARLYYATTTRWIIGRCDVRKWRLQLNMAGRLEDEEYWHASEAKAFNFEDDEVSIEYNLYYGCWAELRLKLIIGVWHYSLGVSCVGCQKAELQGCRKESEKEWAMIAPASVQTHSLVSLRKSRAAHEIKLE